MHLAGLEPGAILCEALDSNGESARGNVLLALARKWSIGILDVDSIARYREEHRVSFVTGTPLPTTDASFRLLHYRDTATWQDYLVLALGDLQEHPGKPPLVRLHSACTTGDLFGSRRCDCQSQLHRALQAIAAEGRGVLLYLPQEGRGVGLAGKLQAYGLQEQGYDTADRKIRALLEGGMLVERVPLEIDPTEENAHYLQTKSQRLVPFLNVSVSTTGRYSADPEGGA